MTIAPISPEAEMSEAERIVADFQLSLSVALTEIQKYGSESCEAYPIAQCFAQLNQAAIGHNVGLAGTARYQSLDSQKVVIEGSLPLVPDRYMVQGFEEKDGYVVVWLGSPKESQNKHYGVRLAELVPMDDVDMKRYQHVRTVKAAQKVIEASKENTQ